jgi:hypothetical protein
MAMLDLQSMVAKKPGGGGGGGGGSRISQLCSAVSTSVCL